MVAWPLVEPTISEGARLLNALEKAGFPIDAAFWLYKFESEEWRLTIATPLYDELGPRESYRKIQDVLSHEHYELRLLDMSVISPNDRLLAGMRRLLASREEVAGVWLRGNIIDGKLLDGAYVYRV
jgi:hypothetical protein